MSAQSFKRIINIAPMMACTDRHDRYLLRLISPNSLLYTEMVTSAALVYGDSQKLLTYSKFEHPLGLQLGGSDPKELAVAAKLGEQAGFIEININVGCPSARVQSGKFGACLMLDSNLVAECVSSVREAVSIPVTIKCRIGVDEHDTYEFLASFVNKVRLSGCRVIIIHARKAWLNGLSPKENREIPPLRYDIVYKIKQDFSDLSIIINGGIQSVADIKNHLQYVDGVMIGRKVYADPWFLYEIERDIFNSRVQFTRQDLVRDFLPYVENQLSLGVRLSAITRHIIGLFYQQPNGKRWRRILSEEAVKPGAGVEVVEKALHAVIN